MSQELHAMVLDFSFLDRLQVRALGCGYEPLPRLIPALVPEWVPSDPNQWKTLMILGILG